jgi:uncharacterized protein YraI
MNVRAKNWFSLFILALMVVLLLSFSLAGWVSAQDDPPTPIPSTPVPQQPATVPVANLPVYQEPNFASPVLVTLSQGADVIIFVGQVRDGFQLIRVPDGRDGWADASALAQPVQADPAAAGGTAGATGVTVRAQGNIRLRDLPSTRGKRLGYIPWGGTAKLLEINPTGEWLRLDYQGTQGWAASVWFVVVEGNINAVAVGDTTVGGSLTAQGLATPAPGTVTSASPNVGVAPVATPASGQVIALGNMRLRDRPSTRGVQIGRVGWGQTATLLGYDATGTWIQVNVNGRVGWSAAEWWRLVD